MSMIIHQVAQGSPEWHALRADSNTASEASAMMGASSKTSRSELLRLKATGSEKEFSDWVQKNLLDKGHEIEAKARQFAESLIGDELFPVTISNSEFPGLLASLDGLGEGTNTVWECKSWNEAKANAVRQGCVPAEDYWQCVQQLLLSGAEQLLYTVSDGTEQNTLHAWMELNSQDASLLLRGWELFNIDRDSYQPVEQAQKVIAAAVPGLPSINYKLNGLALTSNLDVFRKAAEKLVEDSKLPLNTDQEFADREALCKRLREASAKIKLLKEQVVGEFHDIDQFTRDLSEIDSLLTKASIAGEKQVESRKQEIKQEIKRLAESDLAAHIAKVNESLGSWVCLPRIIDNFALVMKGKRTKATLQDAVDTELARLKIEISAIYDKMTANLALLREKAQGVEFLFRDAQDLVQKDVETLGLVIDQRIREHHEDQERQAEAKRLQAEARRLSEEKINLAREEASSKVAPPQQAERRDPAQAVNVPPPADTAAKVEVVDKMALIKAVLAGKAPDSVLEVNLAELAAACIELGKPLPGTSWVKA